MMNNPTSRARAVNRSSPYVMARLRSLFFRMPLRGKSMMYPSETARRHFKTENEALLWMDLRKYPAYITMNSSLLGSGGFYGNSPVLFFGRINVRGERCERDRKNSCIQIG